MTALAANIPAGFSTDRRRTVGASAVSRLILIAISFAFLSLFLLFPLAAVFAEAFRKGLSVYLASFRDAAALSALRLTLVSAAIAVSVNLVFGLAASWCIAKFNFRGKCLLLTLIDLPF